MNPTPRRAEIILDGITRPQLEALWDLLADMDVDHYSSTRPDGTPFVAIRVNMLNDTEGVVARDL